MKTSHHVCINTQKCNKAITAISGKFPKCWGETLIRNGHTWMGTATLQSIKVILNILVRAHITGGSYTITKNTRFFQYNL